MNRLKHIATIAVAAAVLSASGLASANEGDTEAQREVAAVAKAKLSAAEAVGMAEGRTGGRGVHVGIEEDGDSYTYDVTTVSSARTVVVTIGIDSGQVVGASEQSWLERLFDSEDTASFAEAAGTSTTLAAAVSAAERHLGGTAVEGWLEEADEGQRAPDFEVDVAIGDSVHRVRIDGTDGSVVKDAALRDADMDDD